MHRSPSNKRARIDQSRALIDAIAVIAIYAAIALALNFFLIYEENHLYYDVIESGSELRAKELWCRLIQDETQRDIFPMTNSAYCRSKASECWQRAESPFGTRDGKCPGDNPLASGAAASSIGIPH